MADISRPPTLPPRAATQEQLLELDLPAADRAEPTLSEKLAFLRRSEAYAGFGAEVAAVETHMSWVFLAGDKVFKLKKPVCFPYLDFSTLARREAACRAELALNRRLARPIYLDVVPLTFSRRGLALDGEGRIVDWLVVMRRLDERCMLDRAIEERSVSALQIDRLADTLAKFYRTAPRLSLSPAAHLRAWERSVAENRKILLLRQLGLPPGPIRRADRAQRRFLAEHGEVIAARVLARRIVDGHGDLRPEHIWLGEPPQIIDRLEFNPRLRATDPFDEIAYLSLECEQLGAAWVGERIARRLAQALQDSPPGELFSFYRCYRATLRARLTIAHLLEAHPRTPAKWPQRARDYLRIAEKESARLERFLRRRANRPRHGRRASAGLFRQ